MQAQPVNNSTNLPVLKPLKEGKVKDNPTSEPVPLRTLIYCNEIEEQFMLLYGLRYTAFKDLLRVVGYYLDNGNSLSKWNTFKICVHRDTSHQATYKRIELLVKKGLLELVGSGNYVIPSRKALKELSELCK